MEQNEFIAALNAEDLREVKKIAPGVSIRTMQRMRAGNLGTAQHYLSVVAALRVLQQRKQS